MGKECSDGRTGRHTRDSIEMVFGTGRASTSSKTVVGMKEAGRMEYKVVTGCSTKGMTILKGNGQKDSC